MVAALTVRGKEGDGGALIPSLLLMTHIHTSERTTHHSLPLCIQTHHLKQYAASFGVELTVLNIAASYFHEHFDSPPLTAGRLATCAGVSNVVLRPLGGWLSDRCNRRWGPKGRLTLQFVLVLLEGAFLLRFAAALTQGPAAVYLLLSSAFVQAANGSCFALVPYLSEQSGASLA